MSRRALDAVDDAYDQRSPDICEPEWVYWLNRTEIDVMAARCHIETGRAMRDDMVGVSPERLLSGYQQRRK